MPTVGRPAKWPSTVHETPIDGLPLSSYGGHADYSLPGALTDAIKAVEAVPFLAPEHDRNGECRSADVPTHA